MSYYHEHPDRTGDEHEFTYTDPETSITYAVSAVGGGTVGRTYGPGQCWHYTVTDPHPGAMSFTGPGSSWSGSDLRCGSESHHISAVDDVRAIYTDTAGTPA